MSVEWRLGARGQIQVGQRYISKAYGKFKRCISASWTMSMAITNNNHDYSYEVYQLMEVMNGWRILCHSDGRITFRWLYDNKKILSKYVLVAMHPIKLFLIKTTMVTLQYFSYKVEHTWDTSKAFYQLVNMISSWIYLHLEHWIQQFS